MPARTDNWAAGDAYESYMGRWSRPLAREFMRWLAPRPSARWLEVGCGTGALTSAICGMGAPASVVACDPSRPFVDHARKGAADPRVTFTVAGGEDLPDGEPFDYVVSGLVLNFLRDVRGAVSRMRERLRPTGTLAAYVWDYAEGVEFLRHFWDQAVALDPSAAESDEARRFPICHPAPLQELLRQAGLRDVTTGVLTIPTRFRGRSDFWSSFLEGTGPAPAYVASLPEDRRDLLRDRLVERLPIDSAGTIPLNARAWAVRGVRDDAAPAVVPSA